uniref:IBB domain-containing protein n=1 Tax=Graphocephala atropunctata TaxID=36148 RepID=A0A1B6M778_9HEMI
MDSSSIRDNIRTDIVEVRLMGRNKVLSSKRKALQDVVDLGRCVTESEVLIISNKLKSKSSVQVQDLILLKLAFVQTANNIVSFLKVKGALHGLVRELSSVKSNYQLVAAECCCNLALGDGRSCLQVAKAAGPYLIALMSGSNYNLIHISVWALGNLVGSDEKVWRLLHSQGFLSRLLELISEIDIKSDIPARDEILQNSWTALVHMLHMGSSLLTEEETKSIAKIVTNLKCTWDNGLQVVQYLLSCMDAAEEELLKNQVHIKCLKFLTETELNEENIASVTPAVRTVANLAAEPSGACSLEIVANFNLLQNITQKIFMSPYKHLVNEVGWLVGNLVNHNSPEVQSALEEFSLDFQIFESQVVFFNS